MRLLPSLLLLASTAITTVLSAEMDVASAQWKAAVQSDIDNINSDLDLLSSAAAVGEPYSIIRSLKTLTQDVQTATINVQNDNNPVSSLAAMAIVYYVQGETAPKVKIAMSNLVKTKKQVSMAGKRKAVLRNLKSLLGATQKLGDALLYKTPADRQNEAQQIMAEIIGDVANAVQAYSCCG